MNIKAIVISTVLGFTAPMIADVKINHQANAIPQFPTGNFRDDLWSISLFYKNNIYFYEGQNLRTGDSVVLSGAELSGNSQRLTYTWRNGAYQYQVAWQPHDPDFIRLQVFAPSGKPILNRLLKQQQTLASSPLSSSTPESTVTRRQTDNTTTSFAWQNARLIQTFEDRTISGDLVQVYSVAFGPDGKTLVSGGHDGQTKIWDLSTGELKRLEAFYPSDPFRDRRFHDLKNVAISPDGQFLVSAASEIVEVVNLNTGDLQYRLQGAGSKFIFTPDGQTLISGNADVGGNATGSIKLWNLRSGEMIRTLQGLVQGSPALSISKDGSLIAAGSWFGRIQIWNARTGELKREFKTDKYNALATAISPNNEFLFTSFDNLSSVKMWDIRTGEIIRNFEGHSDVVTSIAISPDGQTLATGSKDGTIRIMDLRTRELIRVLKDAGQVLSVSFSPDSRTIASSSQGKIMIWQMP